MMAMQSRAAEGTGKRAELSLDGLWRFQIDRDEQGEARGWHQPGYEPDGWLKVAVPSNWDTYLPELFGYAGHTWYRRTFRARRSWGGSRVHLRFEAANYETTVWLNGELVGSHRGGFDPFEFDVTDKLKWEGDNTLAVRVDNWPRLNRVPNAMGGWWNYGGIYRSVKLLVRPAVRISDVFLRAEPAEGQDSAPLRVDVILVNESSDPVEVSLTGSVTDGEKPVRLRSPGALTGRSPLTSTVMSLAPGPAEGRVSLTAEMNRPKTWSPQKPHLYTLHLDLSLTGGQEDGTTLDVTEVSFGVRRFEVRGTELFLNGKPITLTGFNRHEEYAGSGRVDPGGMLEADLRLIKRLGGNMVRMHYQAHPDLYDLADRLGLLVFAEIPLWQVGNRDATELSDPGVWQTAETMLRTLIGELKNHPSVVIWSVGNESATNKAEARPLIGHLVEVARSLDADRPVAYVGMYGSNERCFDLVDLPGINVYFGQRMAELGSFVDKVHALVPDKPLLITEFGHESVLGLRGEGYGTEEEHAIVLERKWQVFRERRAFVPGGLIWCLADYWHMPAGPDFRWLNRIYFCHGVTTLARRPKKAVAAVRRMWDNTD
jgi:beta-galactosidase/beta-glucuronidase